MNLSNRWIFLIALACLSANSIAKDRPTDWPPKLSRTFPDLPFQSNDGKPGGMGSLKGKVILVELIGMNCPACLAWAGASKVGTLDRITPQGGLPAIEDSFQQYSGISLEDPRVVFVQILLFNMQMQTPTEADVKRWSGHFHKNWKRKPIVLAGKHEFLQPQLYRQTYDLVPGFMLVDKKGVVRFDASGHNPKHSLWTDLLPAVKGLLNE